MTTRKGSTARRAKGKTAEVRDAEAEAADLAAFPHHMSEALRIARTWDVFTPRFYDDLADAWNEFMNDSQLLGTIYEGEQFVALVLSEYQRRNAEKGGAR